MHDTLRTSVNKVPDAVWGEARARAPKEQSGSPGPALPTVGSPLDSAHFDYLRDLPAGDEGLITVPLDAAALVHSAGALTGFADIRVIDASERQIPYLVEQASEPLSLDLELTRLAQPPPSLGPDPLKPTVYRIVLPFEGLPSARLVLTTSARVFRRVVRVGIERQPNKQHRDPWVETSTSFVWTHADQDAPTPAVTVPLPLTDTKELLLMVKEGDNTPLPITAVKILLPAYRLRLFRDRGASLRLAYGRRDLTTPRYDLALLASQVLGVTATEIEAAREEPSRSATSTAAFVSPRLFWVALVIAVVAMFGLIARLLTKERR